MPITEIKTEIGQRLSHCMLFELMFFWKLPPYLRKMDYSTVHFRLTHKVSMPSLLRRCVLYGMCCGDRQILANIGDGRSVETYCDCYLQRKAFRFYILNASIDSLKHEPLYNTFAPYLNSNEADCRVIKSIQSPHYGLFTEPPI